MSKMFHTRILTILTMVLGVLLLNSCQKEFTITAISNDASMGTVAGSGVYKKGTIVQLAAMPTSGYQFAKWDDGNTDNPRSITVEKNATYTAIFVAEGGGGGEEPTDPAVFSVSATQKVLFAPGNLQWSATNGGSTPTTHAVKGGGTAAGTWRFASNQWDTIGRMGNQNISPTYTGWIDLFGWGTSGYNNKYPYMTSITDTDYCNGNEDIAGTNYDWGVYNAIYNPTTNTTDVPGTWRTLTRDEWVYLLNTRTTASNIRYVKATVHGIAGVIVVPDNWSTSIYTLHNINNESAEYASNIIETSDWPKMEAAGCVFLPAAGYRKETSVNAVGYYGYYWSTMGFWDGTCAVSLYFNSSNLYPAYGSFSYYGWSIRLVKDVE